MIHWIFISPDALTKTPYNRRLYVEVHCAVIEYEHGKVEPTYYFDELVDLDDPNDQ